jgi:hypothetical protein
MHDEHGSSLQGNALEGAKDQCTRLACLEKLVGSWTKIANVEGGVGDLSSSLPAVVGGDPEGDPEKIRSERTGWVVLVPRLIEYDEHLVSQIFDVITVSPQPSQGSGEVIELSLEGFETWMLQRSAGSSL